MRLSIACMAGLFGSVVFIACGEGKSVVPTDAGTDGALPAQSRPDDAGGSTPVDSGAESGVDDAGADAADAADADAATDPPLTLACDVYCEAMATSCMGGQAQFPDQPSCVKVCSALPIGIAGDTNVNTIACREHALPTVRRPATCAAAGPTGGDTKDPTKTSTCGSGCEAFCLASEQICTGTNKQFADRPTCMTACNGMKQLQSPLYGVLDTTINDYGCRLSHLSLAAQSTAMAELECPHIVPNSSVCNQ